MSSEQVIDPADKLINDYRADLLSFHKDIYDFQQLRDPSEILLRLSSYSARASWIRFLIVTKPNPKFNRFRIDQLDPFLSEVDRQFKIWSRISAITKDEYDMSRGQ